MRRWEWIPCFAAAVYLFATIGAASIDTPTVDEFAHVPAGLAHWRDGRFDLYPNNPPLGKLWLAVPLAVDGAVRSPEVQLNGASWDSWFHGMRFEDSNRNRYIDSIFRARCMVIPLALLTAWLIYRWARSLFGRFAASMASALFLLAPTILAHGHLATVDMAATASIFAAAFAARWAFRQPSFSRGIAAGTCLGLALGIKFSALFLPILVPLALAQRFAESSRLRQPWSRLLAILAVYVVAAWISLNATMAFQGTFSTDSHWRPMSAAMQSLFQLRPAWLPNLLPREYIRGIDLLQSEVEAAAYPSYLLGQWSLEGWTSYYFVALAVKESELVVVLALASMGTIIFVPCGVMERLWLLVPPVTFFVIAVFANSLCLGIRYVLPIFPFVFVTIGSVFYFIEVWSKRRQTQQSSSFWLDPRLWVAGPILAYSVFLAVAQFPAYLSYFNRFTGGPSRGSEWLIDSNLDWGQDLHRLPQIARRRQVQEWKLLYFGHVDPAQYDIPFELPGLRPTPGVYAISVNYLRGMQYAVLERDREPQYIVGNIRWLEDMVPSEWAGDSIAIFDLRLPANDTNVDSPTQAYNLGLMMLRMGKPVEAARLLRAALTHRPDWPQARFYHGSAILNLGQVPEAVCDFERAIALEPTWAPPQNHLAWILATSRKDELRDGTKALDLARRACQLTGRRQLEYLDTLAAALAECGRFDEAIDVCREGKAKAMAYGRPEIAASFDRSTALFRQKSPIRDGP